MCGDLIGVLFTMHTPSQYIHLQQQNTGESMQSNISLTPPPPKQKGNKPTSGSQFWPIISTLSVFFSFSPQGSLISLFRIVNFSNFHVTNMSQIDYINSLTFVLYIFVIDYKRMKEDIQKKAMITFHVVSNPKKENKLV